MSVFRNFPDPFQKWFWAMACVLALASCSGDEDDPEPEPEPDNLVEATLKGSRSAAELRFLIQVSGMDLDPAWFTYDVDIYEVTYTTRYQDEDINASGLILLPKAEVAVPMVSFQRGTIVRQSEAPSQSSLNGEGVLSAAALASTGFITVLPDLLGFGESQEVFHPYYIEEATAQAVRDMLRAAATLAEEKTIEFNQELFLAGYSQGGYATMAAHKSLEAEPIEGFDLIASFPGAGGYDLNALQEYFFSLTTYPDPYYLAYVGLSYEKWYDNSTLVESFFSDPYASRIPGLFDGTHTAGEINAELTTDMTELVNGNLLNEGDPTYAFLAEKFDENSLTDWVPQNQMFLYHGEADVTVPFENSQGVYETFLANGADPDNISLTSFPGADHGTAVVPYVVEVITKLYELR